jgi:IS5 family transposase
MEKNESSCSILRSLNLDDIEDVVSEAYHKEGAGRPPRKPIGIFKALVVKRVKQISSDRELYRRLWNDPDLREVCDIEEEQKPYHPSQLTRFRDRVGVERLEKILNTLVEELIERKLIVGKKVVFDATFVKAFSRRDPHDNSRGASDPEARVGRSGKTYELGYKLHVAVDAESELPLAIIAAPANDNEKKHAPILFEKALRATRKRMKLLVADSQYSCQGQREQASNSGVRAVIPYPTNQRKRQKGLLRVDRYFRTHGPTSEKRLYRLRSSIERVNSRLKEQLCLETHKVRSLRRITIHSLLCLIAMLLNAVAAVRLNVAEKVRSMTLLAK